MMFFYQHVAAQVAIDIKGQTQSFNDVTHSEVEGHPYLIKDWVSGKVILENKKSIAANLKFDVYGNRVLFQDKNGRALELQSKFTSFTLNNTGSEISNISPLVFVNGYPPTGVNQTDSSLYQLIADGKIKLLKYYKKEITEHVEDTSSVVRASYKLFRTYYIFKNNQLKQIQLNKKSFVKSLGDHSEQLETYFKTNTVDFGSDIDLQKLFTWYNSLN